MAMGRRAAGAPRPLLLCRCIPAQRERTHPNTPEFHPCARSHAAGSTQKTSGRGHENQDPSTAGLGDTALCPRPSAVPVCFSLLRRRRALLGSRAQPVLCQQPLHQHQLLLQLLGTTVQPQHSSMLLTQQSERVGNQLCPHQQHGQGSTQHSTTQCLHPAVRG